MSRAEPAGGVPPAGRGGAGGAGARAAEDPPRGKPGAWRVAEGPGAAGGGAAPAWTRFPARLPGVLRPGRLPEARLAGRARQRARGAPLRLAVAALAGGGRSGLRCTGWLGVAQSSCHHQSVGLLLVRLPLRRRWERGRETLHVLRGALRHSPSAESWPGWLKWHLVVLAGCQAGSLHAEGEGDVSLSCSCSPCPCSKVRWCVSPETRLSG